jgi:holin-like protein
MKFAIFILRIMMQIFVLILFTLIGDEIAKILHLKIPGSILSFFLLFVLLQLKVIKVTWVENGANLLLSEMLLFFVPSSVGIIDYLHLFRVDGLKLTLIISLSTLCVMLVSGGMTEFLSRMQRRSVQ